MPEEIRIDKKDFKGGIRGLNLICWGLIILNLYVFLKVEGLIRIFLGVEIIVLLILEVIINKISNKQNKKEGVNKFLRDFFITVGGGIIAAATFESYRLISIEGMSALQSLSQAHIIVSYFIAIVLILMSYISDTF